MARDLYLSRAWLWDSRNAPHPDLSICEKSTSPRKRGEVKNSSGRYTGQSSAVMAAASAPTISDSDSRPVRNSVEARSFLMFSTSPSPL
jgi:hypothetical protein